MLKRLFKKIHILFFSIAVFAISIFFPRTIFAATLTLTPGSTTVSSGDIVTLKVTLSTSGKYVNNADGVILFPTDMLDVVSVSKNSSIFTLWVEEPSFSNAAGKITFNGGVANPGYNGTNGTVASVIFKAKKTGVASVIFSDAAIRENDGLGTNILTSKSGSVLTIAQPKPVEPSVNQEPSVDVSSELSKPVITSNTHPDQNRWYKNTTASFSWKVPGNVKSLKTLFDKTSNSSPTVVYDSSVSEKTIHSISDGIYYFHLRFIGENNNTSPSAHYVIKVDSTPPKSFDPRVTYEQKKAFVSLSAEDSASGIEFYTVKIDNQPLFKVPIDKIVNGVFELPYQSEGNHSLIVTAFDRAENQTQATTVFSSPSISTPIVSLNTEEIRKGESVIVSGTTEYPNTQVEVVLYSDDEEIGRYVQTTSDDGSFTLVSDILKKAGVISVSARSVLGESVHSQLSEKIYLTVSETRFEKTSLALLGLIIIILLVLILLVVVYIGWHRFFGVKQRINRELMKTVRDIHDTTVSFKEELESQLQALEKIREDRILNKKEEIIFSKIKKSIDDIDKFIEKKLKKLM